MWNSFSVTARSMPSLVYPDFQLKTEQKNDTETFVKVVNFQEFLVAQPSLKKEWAKGAWVKFCAELRTLQIQYKSIGFALVAN